MGITWPKDEFKELVKNNPKGEIELMGDKSIDVLKSMGINLEGRKGNKNYKSESSYKLTVTDDPNK